MNCYLNYKKNILQVMNAVRAYEGISVYHEEDEDIKQWLHKHKFQQVIVLLIDGMGTQSMKNYCISNGFLNSHYAKSVSTVYPPTTVAATTAVLTGKAPCETAWLGWHQYFKDIDKHLLMFLNSDFYSNESYKNKNYTYEQVPILPMVEECNRKGIQAKEIYPAFREDGVSSFEELCGRLYNESKKQDTSYIYAYWDAYDTICHMKGKSDKKSIQVLRDIDMHLSKLGLSLSKDTGLIVLADHGQIEVESKYLIDYPEIIECLQTLPSIETRTLSFHIKDGYQKLFEERFTKHFQDCFVLFTREEVIQQHIFGYGTKHPKFYDFLGDYIACATSNIDLVYNEEYKLKGNHAGTTREELEIPIVLYPK